MWIPYQRGYPIVESQLQALHPAAASAGVTLIEAPADKILGGVPAGTITERLKNWV